MPLAKRRQLNLDRVQPEEQVLAEAARRDFFGEVRVGRRDDPDVDVARAGRADALEIAGLEHAQQLRLQVQRDVGDLVEKQRTAVGELETADAVRLGVGEGALDVAEQLAFEDPFRQAAGVHGHEPPARPARHGVNGLRNGALAGAVLAGDEDVGFRRSDARDQLHHRAHRRRLGDQHRPPVGLQCSILGFEPLLAPQRARELDLRAHDREQPRVLPRLLHEIARAAAHRLDRDLHAAPRRHDDDRQRGIMRAQLREQIEPFLTRGRVARVVQVHQHRVELVAVDRLENRGRRSGRLHPVPLALQEQAERLQDVRLIVRDQHTRNGGLGSHRCLVFNGPSLSKCHGRLLCSVCASRSAIGGPPSAVWKTAAV